MKHLTAIAIGILTIPWALCAVPANAEPARIEVAADDALLQYLAKRFPGAVNLDTKEIKIKVTPAIPAPPPAPAAVGKIPPGLAALAKFKGKEGRTKNNINAATRSGNRPDLEVVALCPGDEGLTIRSKPSLWWFQSAPSGEAEIEFILSELGRRRAIERLRVPLRAMPAGFNSLSLANPALNRPGIELEAGKEYQWTISVRGAENSAAVFATLRRTENDALAQQVQSLPTTERTIRALSDSGNWYELFDIVSRLARRHPESNDAIAARTVLLEQAGLKGTTKP